MPFERPTLAQIRRRIISDFEYELGTNAARIPGTHERAFVEALAGASHGMHGRLAWVALNAFAQSADDVQMAKIAAFYGLFARSAVRAGSTAAAPGSISMSGTSGTPIPALTRATRADGVLYETTEDWELIDGDNYIPSRAVVGGIDGNADVGTVVVLTSPIAGVVSECVLSPVDMAGGTDAETALELRTRLLARLAQPPSGGGPGSYIAWAKQVEGVTRVWEFGKVPSLGWVTVLFMRDADLDPFPGALETAAVEAEILLYAPLHLAGLNVQAPINKALSLTIELTPDDAETRAAVVLAIQNMLAAEAAPPAADGAVFYKSKITTAISDVEGVEDYKVTVPVGDITVDQFELLTLKAIDVTWTP